MKEQLQILFHYHCNLSFMNHMSINIITEIFLILFLLSISLVFAQTNEQPYIAVIEKVAGKVGFFSEDGKELKQVKVGNFPHEAILSNDGKYLYVSDNGVLWMSDSAGGLNTISILDVHLMKKTGEINLGKFHRPHGLAMVPRTDYLLATTENPYGLVMLDLQERKVVRDYDVNGKAPHMVTATFDGKTAFVSNTDSKSVAAIDLKSGHVKLISTGERPQGSVLSLDGKLLYVVNTAGNQISIIDVAKEEVVGTIPTGKGPGRIKITPDGKTLVYNLQYLPGVGFADIKTSKQFDTVELSGRPLSLTNTVDGKRSIASIQDQDKVCIISVPERKIERIIDLKKNSGPDSAIPLQGK
jgi:YVTN family beta-propeller protein